MLQGFKQFMLRGNVLDLAVAVVMGAAFGAVVTALVKDLVMPLIAALIEKPDSPPSNSRSMAASSRSVISSMRWCRSSRLARRSTF